MLENLKIQPTYDGFLFLAETVRNPPVLRPHRHRELELNVVARGEISYVVGNQRYTFRAGSLLWIFPSQVHQLVDRTADAQYYVAVFTPEMVAATCRNSRYGDLLLASPPRREMIHALLPPEALARVTQKMNEMMEEGPDPDLINREAGFGLSDDFAFFHHDPDWLNAGLRHLLLQCWRWQQAATGRTHQAVLHPSVQKALQLIQTSANDDKLATVAQDVGVGSDYLSRLFRQQVGVTFSHYRNSIRLSRFWEHLKTQREPNYLHAAFAAGFGSYSQFHRVFTRVYGQGPRAARFAVKDRAQLLN